jgi:hypothetical protein
MFIPGDDDFNLDGLLAHFLVPDVECEINDFIFPTAWPMGRGLLGPLGPGVGFTFVPIRISHSKEKHTISTISSLYPVTNIR